MWSNRSPAFVPWEQPVDHSPHGTWPASPGGFSADWKADEQVAGHNGRREDTEGLFLGRIGGTGYSMAPLG